MVESISLSYPSTEHDYIQRLKVVTKVKGCSSDGLIGRLPRIMLSKSVLQVTPHKSKQGRIMYSE